MSLCGQSFVEIPKAETNQLYITMRKTRSTARDIYKSFFSITISAHHTSSGLIDNAEVHDELRQHSRISTILNAITGLRLIAIQQIHFLFIFYLVTAVHCSHHDFRHTFSLAIGTEIRANNSPLSLQVTTLTAATAWLKPTQASSTPSHLPTTRPWPNMASV